MFASVFLTMASPFRVFQLYVYSLLISYKLSPMFGATLDVKGLLPMISITLISLCLVRSACLGGEYLDVNCLSKCSTLGWTMGFTGLH